MSSFISALSGSTAVLLGAFGAHGLKSLKVEPSLLATWATASQYHLIHSVALLYVSRIQTPAGVLSTRLFASGTALFSGSLYLLVLTGIKPLGAITPIGGLVLACAWASVAWL